MPATLPTAYPSSPASLLCQRFPKVIYVHGNHEFYAGSRWSVDTAMRKATSRNANLVWLEKGVYSDGGVRILGCPLWFPSTELSRRMAGVWSDFHYIRGFSNWVYDQHMACVSFLRREMGPGDVVVTHYLPSWRSVHPRYAATDTNCFYVSDVESLIVERQPSLWIHGHTHESADYIVGRTRVLCNPFGYARMNMVNPRFDDSLTVDVHPSSL